MASKQTSADEKPKAPKRGFFRRSVSSASDKYGKGVTPNSLDTNTVTNESDDRRVVRRSSMICSEGFDKYTFDCHRHDIPTKAAGLDLDASAASKQVIQNQSVPVSENSAFSYGQSSKPASVEQNAVRKISPFKNLSALSITSPNKNVPMSSKRVTEEVIPVNMPLSYKRVPEETIPGTNTFAGSKGVPESPVTNIPFSFTPDPREKDRISKISVLKNNPVKSPAVTNIPFSFTPGPRENDRISKMSALKNNPVKSAAVTDIPFSFTPDHRENDRITNMASLRNNPIKSAPVKNSAFSFKNVSNDTMPVRNTPLSFKVTPEKSRPVTKAFSFRSVSDEPSSIRNASLSYKHDPDEYTPSRSAPLSFKNVPQQTVSNNYVSDEPMPVRNMPLSLKGASVSLRNIPTSVKREESFTPTRSIPSSLQPVPEESALVKDSEFQKHINDEPIPFRNSPLALKPILTKHISLLKKKTPSVKGPIIKRDSVVHPGKIDMQSSLFIDGRFQNPWPTWKPPTFANLLKFGVTRNKSKVPSKQELDLILPIVKQNFSKLSVPEDGIRVTWIGHSTVLVQMHGLNILTDPIFSERASPSQVVGPKRYRDPPCTIHDLPHINAVVISHSHYDHLDHNTVTLLNARFGAELRWFVPLGLQVWMQEVGCENVVELDWWEENHVPEHTDTFFVFTPAQHWSKRAIGDDNKVLWGSWCVLGPKYRFFFAGDTGYCDAFKQIGKVHGPFDLSAIPIGAYEPRWFMKYQHVNPEEAVKIHMDIRSKKSLAIHWGTFSLANEYYLDPPVKLRDSMDKYEIPPELFFTLKHGESRLIAQNNLVKKYPLSERNANVS